MYKLIIVNDVLWSCNNFFLLGVDFIKWMIIIFVFEIKLIRKVFIF